MEGYNLFSISTGKAAAADVQESLLGIPDRGRMLHQNFVQSCEENPSRLEETVKRAPLKTFADE